MRRRPKPRAPPSGDRDRLLAEEVLYLHSLWRSGPPVPVSAPAPARSRGSGSLATRGRGDQWKRRRLAGPDDSGGTQWPLAPSPPASPAPWPDASAFISSPAARPVQKPSPGSFAQRAAIRAAEEFFSGHASGEDEGSESEGEEEEGAAAGFFMGLFERDAALRGCYERSWEDGEFMCMACAGTKARRGKSRRFRGCVGLVQHARAATRWGRPRAHRALAGAICRVLGWDIERLPSVVIDPRGTLGQAFATEAAAAAAAAAAHEAKDDVGTGMNHGSSRDEDAAKEDGGPGKSGSSSVEDVMEYVDTGKNDGSLVDGDAAKEDVGTGKSGPSNNDNDAEVDEQENGIGSAEKEDITDIDMLSYKDASEKEELCKTVQEEEGASDDKKERAKSADDTSGTCIIKLGNNSSKEEAGTENKGGHCNNAVVTMDNDNAILGVKSMDSSKS